MFTINMFLFLGLVILLTLFIYLLLADKNAINKKSHRYVRWIFFVILSVLGVFGITTASQYMYPKKADVFQNTDYHVIEHKGFKTDSVFFLVQGLSTNDRYFFPDKSLWDDKSGLIRLSPDNILVTDYCEPFYVEAKTPDYTRSDSLTHHKGNEFVLVNRYYNNLNIADDGFILTRERGTRIDTLYQLQIVPLDKKKNKCLYISSTNSRSDKDTSQFRRFINNGYPLVDIIAQTIGFDLNDELRELLEGSTLVRTRIRITNDSGAISAGDNPSPLVLVPGEKLLYADNIRVNGSTISSHSFNVSYTGNTLFYSGIRKSQTDVFILSHHPEDNTLEMRYVLPKMQKLKAEGGRLFITSSTANVIDDPRGGGYYYNVFDSESNHYHINGEIRFIPGTATENIGFEIMDLFARDPSQKMTVRANDGVNGNEFLLSVKSRGAENTKWIFDILDLRESNALHLRHIYLFVLLFLFFVGLRLLIDSFCSQHSLSGIELASYAVVLCLCTVRLIIGWRASTFVPIDDISASAFAKMRDSIWLNLSIIDARLDTTYTVILLPVLLTLISYLKNRDVRNGFLDRLCIRITNPKLLNWGRRNEHMDVVILFAVLMVLCWLVSKVRFERLMNIPAPLILYILFDKWLVERQEEQESSAAFPRILLALIAFLYLCVQDAGFAVIFVVLLALLHAVIGLFVDDGFLKDAFPRKVSRRWAAGIISVLSIASLFCLLRFEGSLMIFAFNYIRHLVFIISGFCFILFFFSIRSQNTIRKGILLVMSIILVTTGIYDSIPNLPDWWAKRQISTIVNSKAHMKYRAEVQKLKEGERIDKLIQGCEFNSSDITYIMRSAHNQWFINQYLKAGESLNSPRVFRKDKAFFQILPHSNQGSSFTTQTTDLVITRYVLAEHGQNVVLLFLALFFMLVLIYCTETKIRNSENRVMLGTFLLMFVIALMVFLSATNRVVFIGQDFPFISLQSHFAALLFPIILMLMGSGSVMLAKLDGNISIDQDEAKRRKWMAIIGVFIFTLCSIIAIKPQGKNKKDEPTESRTAYERFDVSQIIAEISAKTEKLDQSLQRFQNAKPATRNLSKDAFWEAYVNDRDYSDAWQAAQEDSSQFFRSLLEYFNGKQAVKNNPEELMHLRKRDRYWHLAINKKHYFITSTLEEPLQWHGDLLAAKTERLFKFSDPRSAREDYLSSKAGFEANILPYPIMNKVANVGISRFDPSWGNTGDPLLLVHSDIAIDSKQYFSIESADAEIKGTSQDSQLATLLKEGDLVMINRIERRRNEEEVLRWRYGRENENFLAKNIWMNGRQRLFYPLGKESMWSYQFANVVSSAFGNSDQYRDSTLRVSIDYDLHKKFYEILSQKNKTISELTREQLEEFAMMSFSEMKDKNNTTSFYFDEEGKRVKYQKRNTAEIRNLISNINRSIVRSNDDKDMQAKITEAVNSVIQRKFDFSAVAIDGNGRIRLLFDQSKSRNIDPNNIRYLNKFISDLYKEGENSSERDAFGNKALQFIPSGPGSSFKPIAYTAITSQDKIAWEALEMTTQGMSDAQTEEYKKKPEGSMKFDWYGGVNVSQFGDPLSIEKEGGYAHDKYLIHSNNLYHSAIILLGMQQRGHLEDVFKPAGTGKTSFPVMVYNRQRVSFNPDVWFPNRQLNVNYGVMNDGLLSNFRLQGELVRKANRYSNYFGHDDIFETIYKDQSSSRGWAYPETGSLNLHDRQLSPVLKNGFNQMFLGSYPLQVTPLQMATMGMRLTTLNRSDNLTTLDDSRQEPADHSFFTIYKWEDEKEFLQFHQRQVLSQLRQVPRIPEGTAKELNHLSDSLRREGYYLYAKTGTLNDEFSPDRRMKHLLVILANEPLEKLSYEDLPKVKYYVLYLSFLGIKTKEENFSTQHFEQFIDEVTKSEQFKKYMEE